MARKSEKRREMVLGDLTEASCGEEWSTVRKGPSFQRRKRAGGRTSVSFSQTFALDPSREREKERVRGGSRATDPLWKARGADSESDLLANISTARREKENEEQNDTKEKKTKEKRF